MGLSNQRKPLSDFLEPSEESKFIQEDKQQALVSNDSVDLSCKNKIEKEDSRNSNHNTSIFSFSNKLSFAMNSQKVNSEGVE